MKHLKLYRLFESQDNSHLVELIPNRYVYHTSNPIFRDRISNEGLIPQGKSAAWLSDTKIDGKVIFVVNSNKEKYFWDSTYDDDIYQIDTNKLNNKWYNDPNFDSDGLHLITFESIPPDAIKLIHKGNFSLDMKKIKRFNESVSVGIESEFDSLQAEYEQKLSQLTEKFISEIESCFLDIIDNFESTSPKIISEFRPKRSISGFNTEIQKRILDKTGIKYQRTFQIPQPKVEQFIQMFNESDEFIKSYIGKKVELLNLDISVGGRLAISAGRPNLEELLKMKNPESVAKLKISVGF